IKPKQNNLSLMFSKNYKSLGSKGKLEKKMFGLLRTKSYQQSGLLANNHAFKSRFYTEVGVW
ncbi:TPA: hypothetical protein ACKJ5F_001705, partial [Neisseria gonorrhoeae]